MEGPFLEVRYSTARGRGLYAKECINAGAVILSVESSQFITYSTFIEHPFLESLFSKTDNKIVEFAYFLAFSLHQFQISNSSSFASRYLERIPKVFHNLICWTEQQLDSLGNRGLSGKIKKKQAVIQNAFEQIHAQAQKKCQLLETMVDDRSRKSIKPRRGSRHKTVTQTFERKVTPPYAQILRRITLQDIFKYVSVVESRNAYYTNSYDNNSTVGALVPHLELFNHSFHSKCLVELVDQTYKVVAVSNIRQGQEVCVNYGLFTPEQFLQFYGMIPHQDEKDDADNLGPDEISKQNQRDSEEWVEFERMQLIQKYRHFSESKSKPKDSKISSDLWMHN